MDEDRNWHRVMWGVVLMMAGVLFLLDRLGVLPMWAWHFRWWALFVILLGVGSLVRHRYAKDIGTGVLFLLLGTHFLLVSNHMYGLTWHNSWPLTLVAVGASTVAKAIASRWLPDSRWVHVHREEPNA